MLPYINFIIQLFCYFAPDLIRFNEDINSFHYLIILVPWDFRVRNCQSNGGNIKSKIIDSVMTNTKGLTWEVFLAKIKIFLCINCFLLFQKRYFSDNGGVQKSIRSDQVFPLLPRGTAKLSDVRNKESQYYSIGELWFS